MSHPVVNVGIIGGGLMGRELAAAIGRWVALADHPVTPRLTAVCDANADVLRWFQRVESVSRLTTSHAELLADDTVDVVYIAVPHHLHEDLYTDAVAAGRDFMGEKPFGWDLGAAERIVGAIEEDAGGGGPFVRCSSEMPFFTAAQAAYEYIRAGGLGQVLEASCGLLHASDIDRSKPINWKRQVASCGPAGVMADLGMHALHLPLRLGWTPSTVFAQLQQVVTERPGPDGALVACDTWDNAVLHGTVEGADGPFPLRLETKRIAPGETNTWFLRAVGMGGGVACTTKDAKALWRFRRNGAEQVWERVETGSQSGFATVTGPIFEFGFSDAILQMWAAFLAERAGALGDCFGCATPSEALAHQRVLDAALRSHDSGRAEAVAPV